MEKPVDRPAAPGVRNPSLSPYLRPRYSGEDLAELRRLLDRKGVFAVRALPNGLYPAAGSARPGDHSGYQYVWVRDNVQIANALDVCGDSGAAERTAQALMTYFRRHVHRFREIISGRKDPRDPMNRPHVRFRGETLGELSESWPHAQNDALGYFLWFYCRLAREDRVPCGPAERECLSLFPPYFQAIAYWQDRDSGHWEEGAKVSASSIGTVLAGLRQYAGLLAAVEGGGKSIGAPAVPAPGLLDELQEKGRAALTEILPWEAVGPATRARRHDAALLFLLYPLALAEAEPWEDRILADVATHLEGDHGIRRYRGDSYWFPDYREALPPAVRSGDFGERLRLRDARVREGQEAQWCLFDPIVSVIYGRRFLARRDKGDRSGAAEALARQTRYFNRALGQLTDGRDGFPAFCVPEAYYLKGGRYVPNDQTPLLWAQANLRLALHWMERTVHGEGESGG